MNENLRRLARVFFAFAKASHYVFVAFGVLVTILAAVSIPLDIGVEVPRMLIPGGLIIAAIAFFSLLFIARFEKVFQNAKTPDELKAALKGSFPMSSGQRNATRGVLAVLKAIFVLFALIGLALSISAVSDLMLGLGWNSDWKVIPIGIMFTLIALGGFFVLNRFEKQLVASD